MSIGRFIKALTPSKDALITAKVNQFLIHHPDGLLLNEDGTDLADETKDLFLSIMQRTYGANSDRTGRFGASSRGKCQRAQLYLFWGVRPSVIDGPDLRLQNIFNDGKMRHVRWQVMAVQSGALTHAEYPLSMSKYRLTSSTDGLNSYDNFLFELKGDRYLPRLLSEGIPEAHLLQMHTMMLMTGWEKFSYVMEDKTSQEWRELVVNRDEEVINRVVVELEELNEHVEARTFPEPLTPCKAKEGPYKTCAYAKACIRQWKRNTIWPDEDDE